MKLIALLLVATGMVSLRAEETNAAPATSALTETHVTSQSVNFDLKSRQAIYKGDVHVQDPRITLTCERLTATVSEHGGRLDNLIAESNVVALIATNNTVFTVTAAKAVYSYQVLATSTNRTLELTGPPEPKITWPAEDTTNSRTNEFVARRIFWDLDSGNITAEGHRGVFPVLDSSSNPFEKIQKTNSVPLTPAPATTNK